MESVIAVTILVQMQLGPKFVWVSARQYFGFHAAVNYCVFLRNNNVGLEEKLNDGEVTMFQRLQFHIRKDDV